MKSLIIARKDFIIRLKDRKGFMLLILMPLLLTAILGSALGGVMNGDSTTFPKTNLGILLEDDDPIANQFVHDVLQSETLKPYIKIQKEDSQNRLEEEIRKGTIDVAIVFPKGWSQNLNHGKLKELTILTDPGKMLQPAMIQSISQTFINQVQTVAISSNTVLTQLAKNNQNIKPLSQNVVKKLRGSAEQQLHAVTDKSVGKHSVSGMQYYAAAMAAMFLLFNIMVGAKSFLNERDIQTLARLMSTPTKKLSILFGKFLGTLYFATTQFLIFMLATRFLFGVDWGSNTWQTIDVGVAFAMSVSGLSVLVASIVKSERTADVIGGMGVQILAILGGSMVPITIFPDVLRNIAHIAPNTWALTSLIDIMSGTSWTSLLLPISVLVLIGMVATTIGTFRLQAK